ncbi:spore germination protein [Pontibacillus salicampi]|uniref:Spore germination protein n=1 Tax=Pontibacillus salicampi TaxID=1449801 RepID=A0ABV6LLC3_9BACI
MRHSSRTVEHPGYEEVVRQLDLCDDLTKDTFPEQHIRVLYFDHLVDTVKVNKEIKELINRLSKNDLAKLFEKDEYEQVHHARDAVKAVMNGFVVIFTEKFVYKYDAYGPKTREISQSETEAVITGSHEAFVESSETNLSLVRRRLRTPSLKVKKLEVGDLTKSAVFILYLQDIANEKIVEQLKDRIASLRLDAIEDGHMLVQCIDEHPHSIFPQYFTTERPDVIVSKLVDGKICGIVDHSPTAFSTPTNFFEFFASPDDNNQRWIISTFILWMRYIALFITLTFTAFYVSFTTYHYEMLPQALLMSIAESRDKVPFPPLVEAILLEGTIELLREAGVRLPSKIAQTIGIVGGIVIGQAAVEAGLVSNTLIISVAISAIASFVIPNYILSASLRIGRFLFILLAGLFGNFGLVVGLILMIIHLGSLSNMGAPYVNPIAPLHPRDSLRILLRIPYAWNHKRPSQSSSPQPDKRSN